MNKFAIYNYNYTNTKIKIKHDSSTETKENSKSGCKRHSIWYYINADNREGRMFTKKHKIRSLLFALSIALIILGILFLVNAMGAARIFPAFYDIENVLAKYIVVIVTMACGIMLFSSLSSQIEQDKLRNGLTIGITTFSTVLTVPLVYVFIAIFPAKTLGKIGPVGAVMSLDEILKGFEEWFGGGALLYVVLSFMLILSLIFIAVPLATGILTVKGKTIVIGKKPESGKFGIYLETLPVLKKRAENENVALANDDVNADGAHDDVDTTDNNGEAN